MQYMFFFFVFAISAGGALKVAPQPRRRTASAATYSSGVPGSFNVPGDVPEIWSANLDFKSELAPTFDCGMCGGAVEGCPMCRGPAPAAKQWDAGC